MVSGTEVLGDVVDGAVVSDGASLVVVVVTMVLVGTGALGGGGRAVDVDGTGSGERTVVDVDGAALVDGPDDIGGTSAAGWVVVVTRAPGPAKPSTTSPSRSPGWPLIALEIGSPR